MYRPHDRLFCLLADLPTIVVYVRLESQIEREREGERAASC